MEKRCKFWGRVSELLAVFQEAEVQWGSVRNQMSKIRKFDSKHMLSLPKVVLIFSKSEDYDCKGFEPKNNIIHIISNLR